MGKKLSREDYRRIKGYSKEEMTRWLDYHENMMYNLVRKEFEANYQDEIENSIANFLIAVWYTLHYNEETHLDHDELASFMEDLYVSVDLFRKGEYKPEDYKNQMEEDGIKFEPCDYSKIFREKDGKYQKANRSAKELVEQWMSNVMEPNVPKDKLQLLLDRLEV